MVTAKNPGIARITLTLTVKKNLIPITISDSFALTVSIPGGNAIFNYQTGLEDKYKINDIEVEEKALLKMNEYYFNNPQIKSVVDGENADCNTCIFAFEGLGGDIGNKNSLHPNGYLKAMMVVTKGKNIVYVTRNASTLPDIRPDTAPGY